MEAGLPQLLMRRSLNLALPGLPELPPPYRLRPFAPGDAASLAKTLDAAFADRKWTEDGVQCRLAEEPTVKRIWIIEADGCVVATASERIWEAFPNEGYLHWVGTHPDHQGKGLGRAVTLAVLKGFFEAGLRSAVLETDAHRVAAIQLYRALGFEPAFRHPSDPERWRGVLF